jgi:hypothetical protein
MTQEEFEEYIEVWYKEYSAMCERKRIVEQLYVKDNQRFAAGTPVILSPEFKGIDPGVYVTTGYYALINNQIHCNITGAGWSTPVPQDLLTLWKADEQVMI